MIRKHSSKLSSPSHIPATIVYLKMPFKGNECIRQPKTPYHSCHSKCQLCIFGPDPSLCQVFPFGSYSWTTCSCQRLSLSAFKQTCRSVTAEYFYMTWQSLWWFSLSRSPIGFSTVLGVPSAQITSAAAAITGHSKFANIVGSRSVKGPDCLSEHHSGVDTDYRPSQTLQSSWKVQCCTLGTSSLLAWFFEIVALCHLTERVQISWPTPIPVFSWLVMIATTTRHRFSNHPAIVQDQKSPPAIQCLGLRRHLGGV